jgi:hypothetical protein
MTEIPRWERYFREIDRFAREPEALEKLLRTLGDPETMIARKAEVDAMLEDRRWWRKFGSGLREISIWISAVGGGITLLYFGWQFIIKAIS